MKNKSKRYKESFNKIDTEMQTINEKKSDRDEIYEKLKQMWLAKCKREEEKSSIIWVKKNLWLINYEAKYGADMF